MKIHVGWLICWGRRRHKWGKPFSMSVLEYVKQCRVCGAVREVKKRKAK